MNAFTAVLALAIVIGVWYGAVYLFARIRELNLTGFFLTPERDSDRDADQAPKPAAFTKAEEKRYEITRIVHKQPGPEFGQPVRYSGFSGVTTSSYSGAASGVDRSDFDEAFNRTKEHVQRLSDHARRIRELREEHGRRPDGEEDGSAEGSPEEGRTYRPGEVRGPDSINEIRFGGI